MSGIWPIFGYDETEDIQTRSVPDVESDVLDRFGLWLFHWMENVNWGPSAPVHEIKYRQTNFYTISHLIDGDGIFMLQNNSKVVHLKPGDVVINTPKNRYHLGADQKEYTEDFISFCGPLADRLCEGGLLTDGVFSFGNVRRLLPIMQKLQQPTFQNQMQASIELLSLLTELHFDKHNRQINGKNCVITALLDQIGQDAGKPWSITEMASFCSLSINHFRKIFKEVTGMLPKQYLDRVRMNEAAHRLANSNINLAELARKYHYSDAFHFSRSFKRIMNQSPKEFRQNLKNK